MRLVNWDPFRDMDTFFNRVYDWPGRSGRLIGDDKGKTLDWRPSVDISETRTKYIIKAELPEISKDDVDVSVENGILTISGERRFEREDDSEETHRIERMYGHFSRSFTLPSDADTVNISAKAKDGVLKVFVPKVEETKDKPVRISVD